MCVIVHRAMIMHISYCTSSLISMRWRINRKFTHINILVHPKVLHHFPSCPPGAQNKFAKFLLTCMRCCFWCLEKCIKFLNRNAYIMVSCCNWILLTDGSSFQEVHFSLFCFPSRLQSMEKISALQLEMLSSFSWETLSGLFFIH